MGHGSLQQGANDGSDAMTQRNDDDDDDDDDGGDDGDDEANAVMRAC